MEHSHLNSDLSIREVVERIRLYDVADLLACVGALQLVAENAERAIRLHALAQAAISLKPGPGKPKIGPDRLTVVCNEPPLGEGPIPAYEDPSGNPFTEAFIFVGGSYTVLPGIVEEPTYVLEHLARAIFLDLRPFSSTTFVETTFPVLKGLLVLSNEIAERAKLSSGAAPARREGGTVLVPDTGRLQRLKRAVAFTDEELEELLASQGVPADTLHPFVRESGTFDIGEFQVGGDTVSRQPLVRAGEDLVCIGPAHLLAAARHHLIRLAQEHGVESELARRFGEAIWRDVLKSLDFLGHRQIDREIGEAPDLACFHEGFFTLDRDKALFVALATDDLQRYGDEVFGGWQPESLGERFERRSRLAEEAVFTGPRVPNEMMALFVVQTMGRWHVTGIGSPPPPVESPRLILSACDLRTIAHLEGGNELLLWKYARASEKIRDRLKLVTTSQLDEFHLYRSAGYSYYISDDRLPDLLSIGPGGDGALRREAQRRRDLHGVTSFERGRIAEVTCLHEDPAIPLYVAPAHIGRVVSILVEGFEIPVWIVADQHQTQRAPQLVSIQMQLCEMIGFWLWQFAPDIASAITRLGTDNPSLTIRVTLLEEERWIAERSGSVEATSLTDSISVTTDRAAGLIDLNIGVGAVGTLAGPDNNGERQFMARLLQGVDQLAEDIQPRPDGALSSDRIDYILNRHAPLGEKKALIILDPRVDPRLDDRALPRFRQLQSADTNEVLDEIGSFVRESLGFGLGDVPNTRRVELLRKVVGFLYRQLQELVSTVRGDELLDYLMSRHEAITRHIAERSLTIPTRAACYEGLYGIVEQLREEIPRSSALALGSRFLIEYVAARPPNGIRPVSLSVYDRLVALADQIIGWAYLSDLIHYGIADVKLRIVPSGRLAHERDPMMQAQQSFREAYASRVVSHATRSFERHWREGTAGPEEEPEVRALEDATRAEFGKTLLELSFLYVDIMNIGNEQTGPVKSVPVDRLADSLAASLSWKREEVLSALEDMSLKPREDFLDPGPPHKREDVYPWRFNRELSYIRRPLLIRERDGGHEVVWGNRHVSEALTNLAGLCIEGRLRAKSSEMKRYISKVQNDVAQAFNDSVADVIRAYEDIRVRARVKKVDGEPVGGRATPLGDIDVLAANPRRRKLMLIECKDLALARTPQELASELQQLFRCRKGKDSAIARHQKRALWVEANIDRVLRLLELENDANWRVETVVVVDEESFSSRIYPPPIPVMSMREFQENFLSASAN